MILGRQDATRSDARCNGAALALWFRRMLTAAIAPATPASRASCTAAQSVLITACSLIGAPITARAVATTPSAIGNVVPVWIAVSPDYLRSGLVKSDLLRKRA